MAGYAIAQQIKPYDLIQIYKYSLLNEPKYGQNTYTYLKTSVDTHWRPTGYPTIDKDGSSVDFAFVSDDNKRAEPFVLMISHNYRPDQRAVLYMFKGTDIWELYKKQMALMNATTVGSGPAQGGGQQTVYTVNDIGFVLKEFPPGINDAEATYSVTILTNN